MFQATHGSAPRMVREGRAQYADPSSGSRVETRWGEYVNAR